MAIVSTGPRVLVTGASGFVGMHLLDALKDQRRILAVARGRAEHAQVPAHPNIEWVRADLSRRDDVFHLLQHAMAGEGTDIVVHLAAYYDFTGNDAPEYRTTNIDGLRNVLDISKRLHPRRFLFSSSVAACDFTRPGSPITESTPPEGSTHYARSKRIGEGMVREYSRGFPCCIVRFAALFSDWCQYEPLDVFLSEWLSPGWRSRVLAGRGDSAIPYLHIRDAVALLERTMARLPRLEPFEILTASVDGSTSHRELYAIATTCHHGQRRRPLLVPRLACRLGIRCLDSLGRLFGPRPFERPWMVGCIDRRLDVDASRTRSRLGWAPTERLGILRRMPFLIQNRKNHPHEWLKRNQVAARRVRLRIPGRIQTALSDRETIIVRRFEQRLWEPAMRRRLHAYTASAPAILEEQHNLLLGQLMCTIRTGEKGIFMNCCRALAERWQERGLPIDQLEEALEELGAVCVTALREAPEMAGLETALYDHVTMTFQFAIDAVREVRESPLDRGIDSR